MDEDICSTHSKHALKNTTALERNVDFHKQELATKGYSLIDGSEFIALLGDCWIEENIAHFWNDLEVDKYMQDGGVYRKRRFGHYQFKLPERTLNLKEDNTEFFQGKDINTLNGGVKRNFFPVSEDFAKSNTLKKIVGYCERLLPIDSGEFEFLTINTHLIRIISKGSSLGLPTPEGIHRDGHNFVSQHLISRENIYGGISGLYSNNEKPIVHRQLYNPMDTIIIDDTKVKHDVSPILQINPDLPGHRDMLIIDYNMS